MKSLEIPTEMNRFKCVVFSRPPEISVFFFFFFQKRKEKLLVRSPADRKIFCAASEKKGKKVFSFEVCHVGVPYLFTCGPCQNLFCSSGLCHHFHPNSQTILNNFENAQFASGNYNGNHHVFMFAFCQHDRSHFQNMFKNPLGIIAKTRVQAQRVR